MQLYPTICTPESVVNELKVSTNTRMDLGGVRAVAPKKFDNSYFRIGI